MKKTRMTLIGMVAVCFIMTATFVRAGNMPSTPPDGTLTDTSTGVVWLQNADCFDQQTWDQAVASVKSLKSGMCGLTDGSTTGQWRLPTKDELVNRQRNQQGFINVVSNYGYVYWSSVTNEGANYLKYVVRMSDGYATFKNMASGGHTWPVRNRR